MTDITFIEDCTNNKIDLPQSKIDYLIDESELKGYVGPRQCGKTYLLYQDLICNVFNNPGNYLVIGPNYPSLRIIQDNIKACLSNFLLDFEPTAVVPSYTIRKIPNGSTITFVTGYNVTQYFLCGRRYKAVYIDEPRIVDRILDVIDQLIPTVLCERGYISVFGTINEEFEYQLRNIGFNLTHSEEE